MRARALVLAGLAVVVAAGCGGGGGKQSGTDAQGGRATTSPVPATRVEVGKALSGSGFDPAAIYRRGAPGVVTVISAEGGQARGLGSGFVIDGNGEIATNAHVVLFGEGSSAQQASNVYVQFADGNEVPAHVVGTDQNSDVALLQVKAAGLRLRTLPLGTSSDLQVGEPVAAIGNPFGERQSLSVGVVSALDRTIESLTRFQISGAIQTDAAINQGNSGGPLLDARGRVIGINSQIRSSSGGNEGVGFAVPIDTVKHSLAQLRQSGHVDYPYIGVTTVPLYPQLAHKLGIAATRGSFVQGVVHGGPADRAGIKSGNASITFQGQDYRAGGDVIVDVDGQPVRRESDLSDFLERFRPGQVVTLEVVRGAQRRTVRVTLAKRP